MFLLVFIFRCVTQSDKLMLQIATMSGNIKLLKWISRMSLRTVFSSLLLKIRNCHSAEHFKHKFAGFWLETPNKAKNHSELGSQFVCKTNIDTIQTGNTKNTENNKHIWIENKKKKNPNENGNISTHNQIGTAVTTASNTVENITIVIKPHNIKSATKSTEYS